MADIFSVSNPEFLETLATRLNLKQRTAVLLSMDVGELRELVDAVRSHGGLIESIIMMTIHNNRTLGDLVYL